MTIAYPDAIPLDDISRVVAMLTGTAKPDTAVAAKSLWVTTGYVLKLSLGEPAQGSTGAITLFSAMEADTQVAGTGSRIVSREAAAAILQTLATHQSQSASVTYKAEGVVVDLLTNEFIWQQLAQLVLPYLLDLLKKLIESIKV